MQKHSSFNRNILIAVSLVMLFFYNYLNLFGPRLFNSPDENANAVFIAQFVKESSLMIPHAVDYGELKQYIHPRSAFADIGNGILPVGFWGIIILFGLIGKIIGAGATVFITPFLAIVAGWALYALWKNIFNERIAFFATLVFFLHPIVWYYSARSLLPNVSFVSLLIIGCFFLINVPILTGTKKKYIDDILGACLILLSSFIRPNETVWIVPAALCVLIAYRKNVSWRRVITWGIVAALGCALFFYINNAVYTSTTGGYIVSNSLVTTHWYNIFLPFGFHPKTIIYAKYFYFIKMYWWLILPAAIGILYFLSEFKKPQTTKAQHVYALVTIIVGGILMVYYGSMHDISFSLKTIGVAYSRYWLPIHILVLPFIFYGFEKVSEKNKQGKLFAVFSELLIVVVLFLTPKLVYGGIDGLFAVKNQLVYMQEVRASVFEQTKQNDIIVTDREDKFFWPERAVMVRFMDPAIREAIKGFVHKGSSVYYFTPHLSDEEYKKVESYIAEINLLLEPVNIYKDHILYKFVQ